MSSRVRVERLPPFVTSPPGTIVAALRSGSGDAASFLPALPRDGEAWSRAAKDAEAHAKPSPKELAERLATRQRALGGGMRAAENARALGEPGTLAVVTGQQPGLLGGLLLTFHKVAGALHLARHLETQCGRRVVPVLWWASEDHDLDEANRLLLIDRSGHVRRLALDLPFERRSLMHVAVDEDQAASLLADASRLLPDTERTRDVVRDCAAAGAEDLATWSARCLVRLLGDSGLVVVEPPALLPFAGEALAGLVEAARPIREAMRARADALRRAGLEPPLDVPADYVALFLRTEPSGPRRRLREGPDGTLRLREGAPGLSPARVATDLRERPELGSGDAAGRVFVQNHLLPVLAYVGGPTELAYHAEVRAAHEAVGRPYPIAVPRPEATWVDAKADRAADAFGLSLAEVLTHGPRPTPPEAQDAEVSALRAELEAWQTHVAELPPPLRARIRESGRGSDALRRALTRLEDTLRRAREDVEAAFARDRGTDAARWVRLQTLLFPRGRPQERALSAVSLVARHGREAFRAGLEALDPLASGHHVVRVG